MEKIDINPNEEIVITAGELWNILDGLAHISESMMKVEGKLTKKESKELIAPMIVTFGCVAKLLPRNASKALFSELKKAVGLDIESIF